MVRSICVLTCVLLVLGMGMAHAMSWQKFVSADKSYSFHYPKGWKVDEQQSVVEITNPANDELLLVITLSDNGNGTPRQFADETVGTLKQNYPDLKASGWQDDASKSLFQVSFTNQGTPNIGDVLVVKADNTAFWFSFTGQTQGYDKVRALGILEGLVSSLADGARSTPPSDTLLAPTAPTARKLTSADKAKMNINADAFMFVLEFGLGTPLTAGQEKIILTELLSVWSKQTPEELAEFDEYPKLVTAIMHGDATAVEDLRKTMETTMREWLAETDQADPAVKIVRNQLNASSKILVAGTPPLSEMAATSYAEMMAFAAILQKNPNATPAQISAQTVAQYKGKMIKAWGGLSSQGKADACTMPGIWMTIRQLIRAGTPDEQKSARATLAMVGGSQQTASGGSSASSGSSSGKGSSGAKSGKGSTILKNMIRHNTMMAMSQQTFNTTMWSRGYSGWTPTGKIW